ncbi:MAG: DUF6923 family protein [Terriglobia bacterium]
MVLGSVVLFLALQPLAKADSIAYVQIEPNNAFGTIDLNTGVITLLANSSVELVDLAWAGGNLYGGNGNTLYQVNPVNGTVSAVGSGSISAYELMGFTPGGLFALDPSGNLYSVNPGTGATTLIGSIGLTLDPASISLSVGSSTLYFQDDGTLYSLNTSTGAPTRIGNTLFTFGGPVFENGTLFAVQQYPKGIYTLDPTTGATTFVATPSGPSGFWNFEAIAPVSAPTATPEPSSLVLLATALVCFAAVVRRSLWA